MKDITYTRITDGPPARTFLDGSQYWIVELPMVRIGVGHFRPGWIWSQHAGPQTGRDSQDHIGYIQSGAMAVASPDGVRVELGAGDVFAAGAGHDAWVIGEEPCIAIDVEVRKRNS